MSVVVPVLWNPIPKAFRLFTTAPHLRVPAHAYPLNAANPLESGYFILAAQPFSIERVSRSPASAASLTPVPNQDVTER